MIRMLAAGFVTSEPVTRMTSRNTPFLTFRLQTEEAAVSCISFSESVYEELREVKRGEQLAVAGKGDLTSWTDRNGVVQHGLNMVVDRLLSVAKKETTKGRPVEKPKPPPETKKVLQPWAPGTTVDTIPNDVPF